MPKIIPDLEQKILITAKEDLFKYGYKNITTRIVAGHCGIAAGTIYNYYKSKEQLINAVMLSDWFALVGKAKRELCFCHLPIEGIEIIFNLVKSFSHEYQSVFVDYGGISRVPPKRHALLVTRISTEIREMLDKFEINPEPDPSSFIAETLIYCSCVPDVGFEKIKPYVEKLIK